MRKDVHMQGLAVRDHISPVGRDATSLQAPEASFTRRRTSHCATAARLRSDPCRPIAPAAADLRAAAILAELSGEVDVPMGKVGSTARNM